MNTSKLYAALLALAICAVESAAGDPAIAQAAVAGSAAVPTTHHAAATPPTHRAAPFADLELARSIWLPTINDFQVLNNGQYKRRAFILWSSPSRGYLVVLQRPVFRSIGSELQLQLTSTAGSIYPRFDAAIIDGIHYPIGEIYKITRAQAKLLAAE